MNRDWSRERWRKQYVREPLQEQAWPVMARGLRELLNMLAEDDGSLVSDVDDPEEALVTVLGASAGEAEMVRAAVRLLVRAGFLENDGRSIRIPSLPAAQAPKTTLRLDLDAVTKAPRKTSTDRVRRHRARVRARRDAERTGNGGSDGPPVSGTLATVSTSVAPETGETFHLSRGERSQDLSHRSDREINNKKDHLPPQRARETRNVSVERSPLREPEEDEDDDGSFSVNGSDVEQARALSVRERAALILERPELARALHPERWEEVSSVAAALAEACGEGSAYLGAYEHDPGVRAVVKLLAAGIPRTSLEYVARTVPRQRWWYENGKRLGLSSLTLEVVRRNMPGSDGRARILDPVLAKVIAGARVEVSRQRV